MNCFIEGEDRRQATLLPDTLEDYVTDDNPVRVVDVFIAELGLAARSLHLSGGRVSDQGKSALRPP